MHVASSTIKNPPIAVDKQQLRNEFTKAFEQAVTTAADNFTANWNRKNPTDPVKVRFTLTKHKITTHPRFGAQMILVFEMQRNFQWTPMSRVTREFPNTHVMEKHEAEVTFELWMKMFDEITQIGFASVANYLNPPSNATQDDKQGTAAGNIQAVEDEGI